MYTAQCPHDQYLHPWVRTFILLSFVSMFARLYRLNDLTVPLRVSSLIA